MRQNPLKAIFTVKREELPLAILMGSYIFLVITSFSILKTIKRSIFIGYYDTHNGFDLFHWHLTAAQAEMFAKVLNLGVAAVAVTVFTSLANRFVRHQLTVIFSIFFIVGYLIYSVFLPSDLTEAGQGVSVWSFYLFGDVFSTLMVATFFAFLNDSVTPDGAKRVYGIVVFGAVAGGAFGALVLRTFIELVSDAVWMLILVGVAAAIVSIATVAGRRVNRSTRGDQRTFTSQGTPSDKNANPALEGAKLAFSSRYLLAIVGIVGLYEMTSQLMDFQFSSTVAHFLQGNAIRNHFATVSLITNWLSMFVQLFLTSFVMRHSVGVALLFLPVSALIGSAGFFVFPGLVFGSALSIADNGFSYSINQSARESLYVPTTQEEKYKAKAFIDMFVQRFGKVAAIGLSLAITSIFSDFHSIRWLSILTAGILLAWIAIVRYAGRRFEQLTTPQASLD